MGIRVDGSDRPDEEEHIKAQIIDPYEELFAFPATSSVPPTAPDASNIRTSSEFSDVASETEPPGR